MMLMCVHGDGLFGPNTEDSDVVQKSVKCFVEKFWLQTGMLNPQDMCYVFAPNTNPRWHLSNILLLEDLQLTATHNDCAELNKRKFDSLRAGLRMSRTQVIRERGHARVARFVAFVARFAPRRRLQTVSFAACASVLRTGVSQGRQLVLFRGGPRHPATSRDSFGVQQQRKGLFRVFGFCMFLFRVSASSACCVSFRFCFSFSFCVCLFVRLSH